MTIEQQRERTITQRRIGTIPLRQGIVRNTNTGDNGEMEDLMNIVFKDGAYRPVQLPKKLYDYKSGWYFITKHQTADYTNWIGYDLTNHQIKLFDWSSTVETVICDLTGTGVTVSGIKCLKNYLLIITSGGLLTYLYVDDTYKSISLTPIDKDAISYDFDLSSFVSTAYTDHLFDYVTNNYSASDQLKGFIYEKINVNSVSSSKIFGALGLRFAFRLTDGTFIMSSNVKIIHDSTYSGVEGITIESNGAGYRANIPLSRLSIEVDCAKFDDYANEEAIISSLCVFSSKMQPKYDIEAELTNTFLSGVSGSYAFNYVHSVPQSENWGNKLIDTQFYLIGEIPFSEILEGTGVVDMSSYLKLENFYQNYATREALTVDEGFHHSIKVTDIFIFNSRLWCTGMSKVLVDPEPPTSLIVSGGANVIDYNAKVLVKLKVDGYNKYVESDEFTLSTLQIAGDGSFELHLSNLYYPDSRAYEMQILISLSGAWKVAAKFALTSSSSDNLSFYINTTADFRLSDTFYFVVDDDIDTLSAVESYTVDNVDNSTGSQVQLSALDNPLYFPASHCYKVGTGSVNYLAVQQDALSEGQYGQFPMVAFTSEGIYALSIGQGNIIVTSVSPVTNDIANYYPLCTSSGIVFSTSEGIMILEGRKVTCLSKVLEGSISSLISPICNSHFSLYSSHVQVCGLGTIITSLAKFLTDLIGGFKFAYDNINNRLICTRSSLYYSYVFDFEAKAWYRISESYNYFISDFNDNWGVCSRGIVDINDISDTPAIEVHFHTQPIQFSINKFKKLEQSLLKCNIETLDTYASFCVFVSNDKINWTLITGNDRKHSEINDIQLTYTAASYKFFIFAFWGTLNPAYYNTLSEIQSEVKIRNFHKLRSR
jgi:hypothetical protein